MEGAAAAQDLKIETDFSLGPWHWQEHSNELKRWGKICAALVSHEFSQVNFLTTPKDNRNKNEAADK